MQFLTLKELLISGSVFIVLIAFLRLFLLKRLSKKVFITLWYVAVLRLLLPISMPSSFSIYNVLELFRDKSNENATISMMIDIANMSNVEKVLDKAEFPIFYIMWIIGVLFCFAWFGISYIKCRRQFAMSLPISSNDTEYLKGFVNDNKAIKRVEFRTLDKIKTPLTYRIIHPIILLPKKWEVLEDDELCLILEHELIHIIRFDAIFKFILMLILCVYWFNPCVWLMFFLANRDIEYSCDESVLEKIGGDRIKSYANMLIIMEERKKYIPLFNSFSRYSTEERICIMMKSKKITTIAKCLGVVVIIIAICVFATTNKVSDKSKALAGKETVDNSEVLSVEEESTEVNSSQLYTLSEEEVKRQMEEAKIEEEGMRQAEETLKENGETEQEVNSSQFQVIYSLEEEVVVKSGTVTTSDSGTINIVVE